MDRSKRLDEAWALRSQKPKWSANRIAEKVAGKEDAALLTYLRKQLAAADRQACLEECRQLRRENPALTDVEVIQTVKASHHPRRQKLRGIEAEMAAELARERPPEPQRPAEAARRGQSAIVAPPLAGAWRPDWRTLGPMIAEGERAAVVAAQVKADLEKARAWMPSKEQVALLRSQLAMAHELATLYEETRRLIS
jgi:hypothetical protein